MQRAEQNALRCHWMRTARNVVAAASWIAAAQTPMHAQSAWNTLPNAPSALLSPVSSPDDALAATPAPDLAPDAPPNTPPDTPPDISAGTLFALPSAAEQQTPSQNSAAGASQNSSPAKVPFPPALTTGSPPKPPLLGHTAQSAQAASATLPPCPKHRLGQSVPFIFLPNDRLPCQERDQLKLIIDTGHVRPLTSAQKGVLAIRSVVDPFNFLTIAAFSGISIAADAHSVYGPGFKGWGRLAGYSLAEDIQGEFTGVYLIPSIVHEDPRYHRMPDAPIRRRIEHALLHVAVSQHDDGALMPNYADLINYPLSAEISNLYVPGLAINLESTAKRVAVGYATEPIGPLVAEFLPDVAEHLHIHILFAQQILNHIALGSGAPSSSLERSSHRHRVGKP